MREMEYTDNSQEQELSNDIYLEELPFYDVPLPFYTNEGVIIEHTLPSFIDSAIVNHSIE